MLSLINDDLGCVTIAARRDKELDKGDSKGQMGEMQVKGNGEVTELVQTGNGPRRWRMTR